MPTTDSPSMLSSTLPTDLMALLAMRKLATSTITPTGKNHQSARSSLNALASKPWLNIPKAERVPGIAMR